MTRADFADIVQYLQQNPSELFLIDHARYRVARRRFMEAKARGALKVTDEKDSVWNTTLEHNLKAMDDFAGVSRVNRLIRPLYAIDKVHFHAKDLKVLAVGPRTEMELLSLVGQGFRPENIRGLDLISYSPWIDAGNMHKMPYADNSHDVIIAGWVLAYSNDPAQACREFVRVIRDRGVIAIGLTRPPLQRRATGNYMPNASELLSLFGSAVRRVYLNHDGESDEEESRTIVIFDVTK
jgi:SAM-dependent methyltransferase